MRGPPGPSLVADCGAPNVLAHASAKRTVARSGPGAAMTGPPGPSRFSAIPRVIAGRRIPIDFGGRSFGGFADVVA